MSQRDAALLKRVMRRCRTKSPEKFVREHSGLVLYYSARSVRRFMNGEPMPPEIRQRLQEFDYSSALTSFTE